MFCKSSLELNKIFFFRFGFFLSLFIGMIDLFILLVLMLYVQRTTKKIWLLIIYVYVFSLEDNDCFFCFFANDTSVDDMQKSRLSINCYLCLFISFSSKFICIILYIIYFMIILVVDDETISDIDKSFVFLLASCIS